MREPDGAQRSSSPRSTPRMPRSNVAAKWSKPYEDEGRRRSTTLVFSKKRGGGSLNLAGGRARCVAERSQRLPSSLLRARGSSEPRWLLRSDEVQWASELGPLRSIVRRAGGFPRIACYARSQFTVTRAWFAMAGCRCRSAANGEGAPPGSHRPPLLMLAIVRTRPRAG